MPARPGPVPHAGDDERDEDAHGVEQRRREQDADKSLAEQRPGQQQANGDGLEGDADDAVGTQAHGDIRCGEGHQRRDADEQRRGLAEVGRVEQTVDEAADAEGDRDGGVGARGPPRNLSRVDSQLHPMCPSFRKSLNIRDSPWR